VNSLSSSGTELSCVFAWFHDTDRSLGPANRFLVELIETLSHSSLPRRSVISPVRLRCFAYFALQTLPAIEFLAQKIQELVVLWCRTNPGTGFFGSRPVPGSFSVSSSLVRRRLYLSDAHRSKRPTGRPN
jgi:hypothetical protein